MSTKYNRVHVILAEDDEDDQFLFRDVVNELEIDVSITVAQTAPQLLELLESYQNVPPPDIIFLEVNLPGQLPMECLKQIRSRPRYDEVVIIMFCTSELDHDIENSYEIGANLYLNKDVFYKLPIGKREELFRNLEGHRQKKTREEFEVKLEVS
jgi:CheY-like chemotaxis protein